MLILADENCDAVLVAKLRSAGHDVVHILEQRPGSADEVVLELAVAHGRILLTNDLEFGSLGERLEQYTPAIVLMRLNALSVNLRADIVTKFMGSLQRDWHGKFFVVEPGSVRQRLMEGRTG